MTARFRPKITLAETKVDWHHPTHIRFGPGRIKELLGVSPGPERGGHAGHFYIKEGLLPAFYSGRNIKARTYIMAASIMGAIAFDKGLGAGHAVSYAIGGMFKVHHGRVMGMPANLKELGIRKQHIPDIARKALEDANIHTNPVKMDVKKLEDLMTNALKG